MSNEPKARFSRRPRLLWLVLGAMLLVSVLPLGLYHRQVLQLSQEKLTDTESVQQTEVTRSVGEEIQLFDANLYQQLISGRQILALTGLLDQVDDPVHAPQVTRLLENLVASNPEHSLPDGGGQRRPKARARATFAPTRIRSWARRCSGLFRLHAIGGFSQRAAGAGA